MDLNGDKRVDPFSLNALRYHVPMVVGVVGCVLAGLFELSRARAGHTVAWVYAFEWPGFAIVGIIIWWRTITDREGSRPSRPGSCTPDDKVPPDDPGLAAWQQYLAQTRDRDRARGAGAAD
jgi:hypothetical protein